MKPKHISEEASSRQHAETRSWMEQIQDFEEKANQYAQIRDRENVPEHVLNEGINLYAEMKAQAEGEDTEAWHGHEEYLKVVEEVQERMRKKLQDPANLRAMELALEAEALFEKKKYDKCIQKITQAAALDPEYTYRVERWRKAIEMERRKGPVKLTRAINRILFPRLRKLGFHHQFGKDSPKWKEGTMQVRTGSHGREGGVHMGGAKFGKRFGLNVWRYSRSDEIEYLDMSKVGLEPKSLGYLNQEEANAVLERVAEAFEGPILAWLEED